MNNDHYNGYKKFKRNLIYKYKNGLKRHDSQSKELDQFVNIKDFLAKELSKGPNEEQGKINYYYQSYSNVYNYFFLLTRYYNFDKILCMPNFVVKFKNIILNNSIVWFENTNTIIIPRKITEEIKFCESKSDLRFTYFTLVQEESDKKKSKNSSHANIMVVDMYKKTIERFEPYGQLDFNLESKLDYLIRSKLLDVIELSDYEYIAPVDISPIIGLQNKADSYEGMCVTFTILYLQTRLMNPDIPQKEIVDYYLKKNSKQITEIILKYAKFIELTLKKYSQDINVIKKKIEFEKDSVQYIEISENEIKNILL